MRNAEATISKILHKSGILFNTQGYKATSLSDITDATGLTKGAIYRHFGSKEDLEKEALGHLSAVMLRKLRDRIRERATAGEKLRAVFDFFESYVSDPPIRGGCPLLNAAIESDDGNPALRKRARMILAVLTDSLARILENGVRFGQLRADFDRKQLAAVIVASLEGAIMMSKLRGNNEDIRRVTKHLREQIALVEL